MKNTIKILAIVSYLLIMLTGQMIGMPFFLWLLFTMFDFGNIDQIFAVLGTIGVGLSFTKLNDKTSINLISFIFMLSPLISRMIQVPLEKFNYLSFKIPLIIFVSGYIIFTILNQISLSKKPANEI